MKPTVGRIVHYVARGSADGKFPPVCRAAIVAEVQDKELNRLNIVVLNPQGIFFDVVAEDNTGRNTPGTWHWPEREEN